MDNESKMIRQQMDDTRTSLTDKLGMLEQQVVDTVQGASTAMADTVGDVKEMVHDTVQTLTDSVQDTVESVKNTFDLKRQVDRRPWTMLMGATALGFLGGYLMHGRKAGPVTEKETVPIGRPPAAVPQNGVPEDPQPALSAGRNGTGSTNVSATAEPSFLAHLSDTFQAEISQLKALAVGTLLGIVRDIVTKSVPEPMERKVAEVIDGITVKLGGQPIRGHLLPEAWLSEKLGKVEDKEDRGGREQSDSNGDHSRVLNRG